MHKEHYRDEQENPPILTNKLPHFSIPSQNNLFPLNPLKDKKRSHAQRQTRQELSQSPLGSILYSSIKKGTKMVGGKLSTVALLSLCPLKSLKAINARGYPFVVAAAVVVVVAEMVE